MRLSCVIGENTWELSLFNIVFPDIVKVRAKIVCSAAHLLAMILHAHALFAHFTQLETFHSQGNQRLFSVKYLFGEANIAKNFLLLEDS